MSETVIAIIDRFQKRALLIGIAGSVLAIVLAIMNPAQFFRSYLFAYVFWVGLSLGCLAITLLHHLSGGRWGAVVRKFLEAGTRCVPLAALLFLPVILKLDAIYKWVNPSIVAADPILKEKSLYLNVPFFLARAALYFVVWIFLSFRLNKMSKEEDERSTSELQSRFQFLGGIGLLLYGLTATFASIDWMMSLEPHWFSTIYGLLVIVGQVLSAFAFVIALAAIFIEHEPLSHVMNPLQFHDLGKLMFAFVFIWAYLAFSQFLIIWSGNLPEEIPWYMARSKDGWRIVAIILVLFHFALPFALLLSRDLKKNPRILAKIAIGVLVMRYVDLFWMVGPETHEHGSIIHPLDILLPLGIGGLWLSYYFKQLKSSTLIPMNDPNLQEALEDARA